jgi:hypothetical protein
MSVNLFQHYDITGISGRQVDRQVAHSSVKKRNPIIPYIHHISHPRLHSTPLLPCTHVVSTKLLFIHLFRTGYLLSPRLSLVPCRQDKTRQYNLEIARKLYRYVCTGVYVQMCMYRCVCTGVYVQVHMYLHICSRANKQTSKEVYKRIRKENNGTA